MSKPAKGVKRVCASCGARFYDLSRTPIICPVCQAVYHVPPPPTRRGERAAPVEIREKIEPVLKAEVVEEAETISLEDAEEAGESIPIEEDEEIAVLGDDEPGIPAADDDSAFLEQTDEEPDVSGIVGPPGEET